MGHVVIVDRSLKANQRMSWNVLRRMHGGVVEIIIWEVCFVRVRVRLGKCEVKTNIHAHG